MKKFFIKLLIYLNLTLLSVFNVNSLYAEEVLNVYNWGDYINPAVLEKFTAETGIKINLDVYGSNEEMLAKIQAGASGYDIVFPSVHFHDILYKLDLLHESKINESPLFGNIDKDDVELNYTIAGYAPHILDKDMLRGGIQVERNIVNIEGKHICPMTGKLIDE